MSECKSISSVYHKWTRHNLDGLDQYNCDYCGAVKYPTPKPPAPEPIEVTSGGDIPIGALFGIMVLIIVFGLIIASVLGEI